MSNYIYTNDGLINADNLAHYGVKGMKWGKRKAKLLTDKAKVARDSAKEWDEIGKHKSDKLRAEGKTQKADKVAAKYKSFAERDRFDARIYEKKAAVKQREAAFQGKQAEVGKSRSFGSKLATNILAGPFANRTYNSVRAAGGTKVGAAVVTGLVSVTGPLGHVVAAHLYTKAAGERKTNNG